MSGSYYALILKQVGPFYSYRPFSTVVYRALCRISGYCEGKDYRSGILGISNALIYDGNAFHALGTFDMVNLDKIVDDSGRALYKGPITYTVEDDKIVPSGLIIREIHPRIVVSRRSFTSSGEGRIAYITRYRIRNKSRNKLAFVVHFMGNKNRLEEAFDLLGRLGLGRYTSIGGGMFELEDIIPVDVKNINIDGNKSILLSDALPSEDVLTGPIIRYRYKDITDGKLKLATIFAGGLIKKGSGARLKNPLSVIPSCYEKHNMPRPIIGFPYVK